MQSKSARIIAVVLFVLSTLLFSQGTQKAQVIKKERPERTKQLFETLIARAESQGPLRVIVGVDVPFTPEGNLPDDGAREAQRAAIASGQESLLAKVTGVNADSIKRFEYIPYVALEIDAAGLRSLRNAPEATSLEEDLVVQPLLAESTGVIGAQNAWAAGFSGQGQTVAIIDSGVDKTHPFLAGKVVSEACYSANSATSDSLCPGGLTSSIQPGSAAPCPECGHGTHVAGVVAGKGTSFSGVARDANLIAIQVFHREKSATTCGSGSAPCLQANWSDLLAALNRVYQLSSQFQIAAVNMALGTGRYSSFCDFANPSITDAINTLASVRVATVIATGNDGYNDSIESPACISSAIRVGSTDDGSRDDNGSPTTKDQVTEFSNIATIVDLLAPGKWIRSSVPGGGYFNFDGTSASAAHVSGAWAVLKSRFPNATVDQVLSVLSATGVPARSAVSGITKPRIQLDAALSAIGTCTYEVTPSVQFVPFEGGTINVVVSSPSNCSWNVMSSSNFVTVQSPAMSKGNGVISLQVASNNQPEGRFASLTIAGKTIDVGQVGNSSACLDRSISIGQTVTNTLSSASCLFNYSGLYYTHVYAFSGQAGTLVSISLRSNSFDSYLRVIGPDWIQLMEDDNGGGNADSRIPPYSGFVTLPASGTYRIAVTSAAPLQSGSYTLDLKTPCSYSISGTNSNFSQNGGSGQVTVTTGTGCPWSATSNSSWITVTSGASNSGSGATTYTVAPNSSFTARTGTITIANQTITITQQAAAIPCSYSVSPLEILRGNFSSLEDINITTTSSCSWTAASNASWISLISGSAGSGSATIRISIAANSTGARRTGTLTIASQTVNVTQEAVSCPITLSTSSSLFTNTGGTGSVSFTASGGCSWTARSNAPWVQITSPSNGSGNGSVSYVVASNTSAFDRTATVEIGGKVLTVRQTPLSSQALIYHGKLRDRVGAGDAALTADGSADATLQFRNLGLGTRTITRLVLSRNGGGTWDTVAGNGQYVLGVTDTLDSVILNSPNGGITKTISDGSSLYLFASDFGNLISAGNSLVLTISYSTGATSQFNLSVPMNALPPSLAFAGKNRDVVGRSELSTFPDGDKDGAFTASFPTGGGQRVIRDIQLSRDRGGVWDTAAGNGAWVLGVASSSDGIILNAPNGSVNLVINDGANLTLFAADAGGSFVAGDTYSVTITFSDGSTSIAQGQIAAGTSVPTLTFEGRIKDMVGRGESAMSADGSLDGSFSLKFPAGGGFGTISKMTLIREGGGSWDTVSNNGAWVLGYADSLSSTSLRNATNGSLNVTVPDGGSAVLFASDNFGLFSTGIRFMLIIEFSDSSSAIAQTTITGLPPEIAFRGRLRDRVGQGDLALASDGQADAVFAVTLPLGNGARTVSRMTLSRAGGGAWDTVGVNGQWALGVADSIDGPLRNSFDSEVNFVVPDGGGFVLFASDNGGLFAPGTMFTLSVTFSDGQTMTGSTIAALVDVAPILTFNGRTTDHVGRGDTALQPDGSPDGTFSLTFPIGTGERTITRLQLVRAEGGAWDTVPANGLWVVGVASASQPSSLRNASDGSLNLTIHEGEILTLFVSDNQNLFATGSTFLLTITYSDGGSTTATVTIGTSALA